MINKFENIVFQGGFNTKSVAYCGVIKELEKHLDLENLKRYAGVSLGALFATMLCIGFTSDEILNLRYEISDILFPTPSYTLTKLFNMFMFHGMHSCSEIKYKIKAILSLKIDPYISLEELYEETGKDLIITVYNATKKHVEYLHYQNSPDLILLDALTASMTIPFVYSPHRMYFDVDDEYVDGSVGDEFPTWIFNDPMALNTGSIDYTMEHISDNYSCQSTLSVAVSKSNKLFPEKKVCCKNVFHLFSEPESLENYFKTIVKSYLTSLRDPDDISNQILVYTDGVDMTERLSKDDTDDLVEYGRQAVSAYYRFFLK